MSRLLIIVFLFCAISTENVFSALTVNKDKTRENMEKQILSLTTKIHEHQAEISNQNTKIAQQNTKFAEQNTQIENQNTKFALINTRLAKQDSLINDNKQQLELEEDETREHTVQISEQQTIIAQLNKSLAEQTATFEEQASHIADLNTLIDKLNKGNIALNKLAVQSSTYEQYNADRAVDGNIDTTVNSGACAMTNQMSPSWWCVDLLREYNISTIKITNSFQKWLLVGFNVRLSSTGRCDADGFSYAETCYTEPESNDILYLVRGCNDNRQMSGRYVFIGGSGIYKHLTICEVEIYSN